MKNQNLAQDLVELSISDRIDREIRSLGHSQNTSGNSLPQFPPLVWPYPAKLWPKNRLEVGSNTGYQAGGVGPYSIEILEESGLYLSGAWRITATVLINTATAPLPEIEAGLRGSRVLETAISIDLAFALAASHAKSRTEWLASQPMRAKAFPRLFAERLKCEDNQWFELDIFRVMSGSELIGGRWGTDNCRAFRFQVTPLGIAYAYALRLLISKRISPPAGESRELIAAFFAWWRSLGQQESRLALHLLLSDGKPLGYLGKPDYEYLPASLGQILGKNGNPAHHVKSETANQRALVGFKAIVSAMPNGLRNLQSHYTRALSELRLPTVPAKLLKPKTAPSLRFLCVDGGEASVPMAGVDRPCGDAQDQTVIPNRPGGELNRPGGPGYRPDGGDIDRKSCIFFNREQPSSLSNFQQSGKQASMLGRDESAEQPPACPPDGDKTIGPGYIQLRIPLDEYFRTLEEPPSVYISTRGPDGIYYATPCVPNPVRFANPDAWRYGRYDPDYELELTDVSRFAEPGAMDKFQRSWRHPKQRPMLETDGLTVEEADCIRSVYDSLGNRISSLRELLAILLRLNHGQYKTELQLSASKKKYLKLEAKVLEMLRDVKPLPFPDGRVFQTWTVGGMEQLHFLLEGYSRHGTA